MSHPTARERHADERRAGSPFAARLERIERSVDRMEKALLGDEAMGHTGIVGRQASVEERLAQVETERADEASQRKGVGRLLTVVAACSAAISGFVGWAASHLSDRP